MADRWRSAWAVGLAAALAPLLVSCSSDPEPLSAPPGTFTGSPAEIQLPHGRVSFVVADASPVSADDITDPGVEPSGEYVGVEWGWEPGGGVPGDLGGFLIADEIPSEVSIEIDGVDIDLGGATSPQATYVPAPAGTAAGDVTLSVTLDGLTQTIRGDGSGLTAGAAEPLYSLPESPQAAQCDLAFTPARVKGEPNCEAATVRLPFVTELGWAADGTSWLVVGLSVQLVSYRVGEEETSVQTQQEQLSLDGEKPVAVLHDEQVSRAVRSTQSVFSVPSDGLATVQVTRTVLPATDDGEQVSLTGLLREQP